MFTIIELFSEEEEREINHHGAMRIVDDLQKEDNRQGTKTLNAYKIAKKFGNFMIYETKFKIDLRFTLISETDIVPIFAVIFSLVYCIMSMLCYFNY